MNGAISMAPLYPSQRHRSACTHDAIVFGPGPEGEARKLRNEPLLMKPITLELGGVGPAIVVPGPWSAADLRHHAARSVAYGSFYPFPRSWMHGDLSLLPKPPWFVTNRTAAVTVRRVAAIAVDPSWRHLPGIFLSALRG